MPFAGIILASQSPRREDLLKKMGVHFTIVPSGLDEEPPMDEAPGPYAARLAVQKAVHVGDRYPQHLVIGADTIVALGDRIMGKPDGEADAFEMLSSLSGRWHDVWTGVCLHHRDSETQLIKAIRSSVCFRDLSDDDVHAYIATGEPMDKAGAYAIQGKGGSLVKQVKGSYHNVIGLPTMELGRMLESLDAWNPEGFQEEGHEGGLNL